MQRTTALVTLTALMCSTACGKYINGAGHPDTYPVRVIGFQVAKGATVTENGKPVSFIETSYERRVGASECESNLELRQLVLASDKTCADLAAWIDENDTTHYYTLTLPSLEFDVSAADHKIEVGWPGGHRTVDLNFTSGGVHIGWIVFDLLFTLGIGLVIDIAGSALRDYDMAGTVTFLPGQFDHLKSQPKAESTHGPSNASAATCAPAVEAFMVANETTLKGALGDDFPAYRVKIAAGMNESCVTTRWADALLECLTSLKGAEQEKCASWLTKPQKQDMADRMKALEKERQAAKAATPPP